MPKMSAKNENCNTWTWVNWIIFRFCIFSANDCFDSRGCVMLSSFQHWASFCEDHKRWYSQSQSLLNISFEASSCIYADTIELASHFWSQRRMNLIIIVSLLRGTKILLIFAPDKCSWKRCNWCRRAFAIFFSFCCANLWSVDVVSVGTVQNAYWKGQSAYCAYCAFFIEGKRLKLQEGHLKKIDLKYILFWHK